jgi:nucleoid-associated protein YejK
MAEKKQESKKNTTPKELAKYEFAFLAANLNNGDANKRSLAGVALKRFYDDSGVDKKDPIINYAIQTGGIGEALKVYASKYVEALTSMKFKDYIAYVGEKGYKLPENIPTASKLLKKYGELTFAEIHEGKENNEELQIVDNIFQSLQHQVVEGNLYGKLIKTTTDSNLKNLEARLQEVENPREELRRAA